MAKPAHSELESFVLGLVWQLGPCSPYDVRRHMRASPSTQWSASAGAIYPLVKRLEHAGLLASERSAHGKRERRIYAITAAGMKVLRAWIGPPLRPEVVSVSHDPLRSRVRFLGALTPAQRTRWFAAASEALNSIEQQIRAWDEANAAIDTYASHMTVCGMSDLAARREWLAALERAGTLQSPATRKRPASHRTRSGSGKSR